jgi:FixJ family two-component response regulator
MAAHVLTVVEDLLFRPRVTSMLKIAGYTEARFDAARPPADQLPEGAPAVGLVDLGSRTALPAAQALLAAGIPVVAYCGHADTEKRAAAQAAGVTVLASKGEVHGGLPVLIERALAHTPDPDCDHC